MLNIRKIIAACDLCQKSKRFTKSRSLMPKNPLESGCFDVMGTLPKGRGGVTQLLVIVDASNKLIKLYPFLKDNHIDYFE